MCFETIRFYEIFKSDKLFIRPFNLFRLEMTDNYSSNVKRAVDNHGPGKSSHEDESSRKRVKTETRDFIGIDFDTSQEAQLRCLMKTGDAGAIIGKGGSNVKRLREEYNLQVALPNSMSVERILSIHGEIKNIGDALYDCFQLIQGDRNGIDPEDATVECRMLIHSPYIGGLIGHKGERIREIRERMTADVKIYEDCCPGSTERVFKIDGSIKVVVSCVMYVLHLLELPEIKSRHGANNPAGYGAPKPGPRKLIQYDPINNADLNDGAFRGHMPPPPPPDYGYRGFSDDINYSYDSYHGQGQNDPMFFDDVHGPIRTETITVTSEHAGAIIGTGGRNINVVRQRSKAEVRLEDGNRDGASRKCNITGTEGQIGYAKFLIDQFINEDRAQRAGGGGRRPRGGGGSGRDDGVSRRGGFRGRGGYGRGGGSERPSEPPPHHPAPSGGNDFSSYPPPAPPVSSNHAYGAYYATPAPPQPMANQAPPPPAPYYPQPNMGMGATPQPTMASVAAQYGGMAPAQPTTMAPAPQPLMAPQPMAAAYGALQPQSAAHYGYGTPQQPMGGMPGFGY